MSKYVAAMWLSTAAGFLYGQTPLNDRVLVVYNSNAADSLPVARHYMSKRQIPDSNRCRVAFTSPDYIKQEEFESRVKTSIRKCIESVGKQKILYIVFSYQTPYAVQFGERGFALDSVVADLWDEYTAATRPGNEVSHHPYFLAAQSQGNVYPPIVPFAVFRDRPGAPSIYSVWRLDAATPELAKGLVDKAIYAETNGVSGKGCFDLRLRALEGNADYESLTGDWDIHQSAEFTRRAGFEVVEDGEQAEFGTPPAPMRCEGAVFYAGWYSLNHYNDAFSWNPGAIGFHLDSASAANPRGAGNWSGGAVMKGITITSGAAGEPYLEGLAHPDQVFLGFFLGANAGDALLRSTRWLKWMILNIGDPLYRPFPKGVPSILSSSRLEALLALIPPVLVGGDTGSGVAALTHPAPEGGTIVSLHSNRPDLVIVPKTVSIPARANNARFLILTRPPAGGAQTAIITMSAGDARRSNTLVLQPCEQPALTLSPARVKGGTAVAATVLLSRPAPPGGAALTPAIDKPSFVSAPGEVRVPAASTRADFQITTRVVTAETAVTVKVWAGGCVQTAALMLTP